MRGMHKTYIRDLYSAIVFAVFDNNGISLSSRIMLMDDDNLRIATRVREPFIEGAVNGFTRLSENVINAAWQASF